MAATYEEICASNQQLFRAIMAKIDAKWPRQTANELKDLEADSGTIVTSNGESIDTLLETNFTAVEVANQVFDEMLNPTLTGLLTAEDSSSLSLVESEVPAPWKNNTDNVFAEFQGAEGVPEEKSNDTPGLIEDISQVELKSVVQPQSVVFKDSNSATTLENLVDAAWDVSKLTDSGAEKLPKPIAHQLFDEMPDQPSVQQENKKCELNISHLQLVPGLDNEIWLGEISRFVFDPGGSSSFKAGVVHMDKANELPKSAPTVLQLPEMDAFQVLDNLTKPIQPESDKLTEPTQTEENYGHILGRQAVQNEPQQSHLPKLEIIELWVGEVPMLIFDPGGCHSKNSIGFSEGILSVLELLIEILGPEFRRLNACAIGLLYNAWHSGGIGVFLLENEVPNNNGSKKLLERLAKQCIISTSEGSVSSSNALLHFGEDCSFIIKVENFIWDPGWCVIFYFIYTSLGSRMFLRGREGGYALVVKGIECIGGDKGIEDMICTSDKGIEDMIYILMIMRYDK